MQFMAFHTTTILQIKIILLMLLLIVMNLVSLHCPLQVCLLLMLTMSVPQCSLFFQENLEQTSLPKTK